MIEKSRVLHLLALVLVFFPLVLVVVPSAFGNHTTGTYGTTGYQWLARDYDFATEWMSSNYCNTAELDAYDRVKNSTTTATYMSDRWPSGLQLVRDRCDGVLATEDDILLQYSDFCDTHGCEGFGGENHSIVATTSYCAYYSAPYPCGVRSTVHLNKPKYLNTTSLGRQRLIMHETGHSQGLGHHCSSDSIMNQGIGGCNGNRWLEVMSYLATDREGVRAVYPNWQYP